MATQWLRRAWLLAACASALLLASCGGGGVVSPFSPDRLVAFGDGMADLGQAGARYTVNDGSTNNWTESVAKSYGLPLATSGSGGLSYATGNARVTAKPDAAGDAATPTVKEQVDAFLAANSFSDGDLVMVGAGTADVIVQGQAAITGAQTSNQMLDAVDQAARDLGAQVKRIVNAGADHVLVVGPYNLGRSPWAQELDHESLLQEASTRFATQLLVTIADLGGKVLYIDAPLYFNNLTRGSSDFDHRETAVCNSVDSGPGIGTGSNQVNSFLCTPTTIIAGADYSEYIFADRVYLTPRAHVHFADYIVDRLNFMGWR